MAVSAKILDAMVAAGCSAEQLVAVVRAAEEAQANRADEKREQARLRKQRQRDRAQAEGHAMSRDVTRDMRDTSPSPFSDKERSPIPPKEINSSHTPITTHPAPEQPSVWGELTAVLDEAHAQAVIDHKQSISKPLTWQAARFLASQFRLMPDPNAAAEAMVGHGWKSFEPEWVANRKSGGGNRSPPRRTAYQERQDAALAAVRQAQTGASDGRQSPRDDADIEFGPEDYQSHGNTATAR